MKCEVTDAERKIAQMLGDAWNAYLELPAEHPMERDEFCRAIHVCQNMVLSRGAVRAIKSEAKTNPPN